MVMLEDEGTANGLERDEHSLIGGVVCKHEWTHDLLKMDSCRWLLDSGASSHYIKDVDRFCAYKWLPTLLK